MRKTSKRTTTRQVQKQQKKLREHNAKVRRDKKKNPKKYSKSKKVTNVGIVLHLFSVVNYWPHRRP